MGHSNTQACKSELISTLGTLMRIQFENREKWSSGEQEQQANQMIETEVGVRRRQGGCTVSVIK
jgi:hypothetical protein